MYSQQAQPSTALITCSHRPDLARCERLCRSVDRHVDTAIPHLLLVPSRDLGLFGHLADQRRSLIPVEEAVPGRFRQRVLLRRWWLDESGWPVRGWVMQQVTKLSANRITSADNIVFADSDLMFIRDFGESQLLRGDRLRLHRRPGAKSEGEHRRWHEQAAALLGLPSQYFGADFIGQLISWRRSHLEGLQAHIERVHGVCWSRAVARSLRVSEYILYGAYIEAVVGLAQSEHYGCSRDLCHCCWFDHQAQALADGAVEIAGDAVALHVQSNIGLSEGAEGQLFDRFATPVARRGGLANA